MAENIVAGLFGLTPQMYQNQQYQQDLNRGISMAQLSPGAAAQAGLQASVGQLGRGFAGAMGIEDPQLKIISARNSIAQQIDQTDPESILKGAQMLAQAGDQQGAMALAQYARQAQSEMAQTQQRKAAALASTAQASRERSQAIPNDIQVANEIATLEDALSRVEDLPADPERTRAKNLLTTRLAELRRLTAKGEKATAANIKEVGVAETTREPVYLDVNNDQQFIYKLGADGKQVRVPFTGGVDRKISETKVSASASSKGSEEGAKTIAELDAKRLGAAQVSAGKAVEQAGLLQELLKTPQPISGSGAPARVGALRVFSTFGLTSPKDDEALGNADKFNALAGERVISFIKALGSQPTDTDREFARSIGPALEKGTKTNADLINFLLERSRKVVKDADSLETHFYNNNYSLRGYKSPFLTDLETPKSKASDLTTEELQRIARGKK
jgi:hypothetical protein